MIEALKDVVRRMRAAGVRLGALNNVMTALAALISVALLFATVQSVEGYDRLRGAMERYVICQQNALRFQEGCNYLTDEAHCFVATGDVVHAQNHAEEVEVTRRREQAAEAIGGFLQEEDPNNYLAQAMEDAGALVETECYAMRLAAAGYGTDPDALPERIRSVQLTAEDAALTPEEQRTRAVLLVCGVAYTETRKAVSVNVDKSIIALTEENEARGIRFSDQLNDILRWQRALIGAMLAVLFIIVVGTYLLVIRPLKRGVARIRSHEKFPVEGSAEMKFLARTYNEIDDQHARRTEKLAYSANHDALTGLYNRRGYESFRETCNEAEIGALIIDVDDFKQFNDTYGHDVGDQVLKFVADVLQHSFRSDDFVGRIGGDEFCVIMMRVDSRVKELVQRKIAVAGQRLREPDNGLPAMTLSVGVAFGDRQNPSGDIFKDADTALYRAKRAGRGGCEFY